MYVHAQKLTNDNTNKRRLLKNDWLANEKYVLRLRTKKRTGNSNEPKNNFKSKVTLKRTRKSQLNTHKPYITCLGSVGAMSGLRVAWPSHFSPTLPICVSRSVVRSMLCWQNFVKMLHKEELLLKLWNVSSLNTLRQINVFRM